MDFNNNKNDELNSGPSFNELKSIESQLIKQVDPNNFIKPDISYRAQQINDPKLLYRHVHKELIRPNHMVLDSNQNVVNNTNFNNQSKTYAQPFTSNSNSNLAGYNNFQQQNQYQNRASISQPNQNQNYSVFQKPNAYPNQNYYNNYNYYQPEPNQVQFLNNNHFNPNQGLNPNYNNNLKNQFNQNQNWGPPPLNYYGYRQPDVNTQRFYQDNNFNPQVNSGFNGVLPQQPYLQQDYFPNPNGGFYPPSSTPPNQGGFVSMNSNFYSTIPMVTNHDIRHQKLNRETVNHLMPNEIVKEVKAEKFHSFLMWFFGLIGLLLCGLLIFTFFYDVKYNITKIIGIDAKYIPHPFLTISFALAFFLIFISGILNLFRIRTDEKRYLIHIQKGINGPPLFIIDNYKRMIVRRIIFNWIAFPSYFFGAIVLAILYGFQAHAGEQFKFAFWTLGSIKDLTTEITINIAFLIIMFVLHIANLVTTHHRIRNLRNCYGYELISAEEATQIKHNTNKICLIIFLFLILIVTVILIIPWWLIRRRKLKLGFNKS